MSEICFEEFCGMVQTEIFRLCPDENVPFPPLDTVREYFQSNDSARQCASDWLEYWLAH